MPANREADFDGIVMTILDGAWRRAGVKSDCSLEIMQVWTKQMVASFQGHRILRTCALGEVE